MSSPILWGPNNTSNSLQNSLLLASGNKLQYNGQKNYVVNGDLSLGTTSGFVLGNASLTNFLPSGTPTFGSGASGTLSISVNTATPLSGLYSLDYATGVASTAGNFVATAPLSLDLSDRAKVLGFKFSYSPTVNAGNGIFAGDSTNSYGVAIYDITNSAWIIPSGVFNITQNSGVGICSGTFQTPSNMSSFRLVIFNANGTSGALTLTLDEFFVGPQVSSNGAAMSDWAPYTPTITGFGTPTSNAAYWRRVGDSIQIRGSFVSGAPTAVTAQIGLPPGRAVASFLPTLQIVGRGARNVSATSTFGGHSLLANANYTSLTVGVESSTQNPATESLASNIMANGELFRYESSLIPVQGWSSSTVQSADTDTRVIAAKYYLSSNQALTSGDNKLSGFTAVYDTSGSLNGSSQYVAPVSGKFKFNTNFNGNASVSLTVAYRINGGSSVYIGSNPTGSRVSAGDTVDLRTGDYIEFYINVGSAITALSGAGNTFITIERLSGPAVVQATESVTASYASSSGQSIPNTGQVIIDFSTKSWDSHSSVTTGAAWKFVAGISGTYQVDVRIGFGVFSYAANNEISVFLWKNGSLYRSLGYEATDAAQTRVVAIGGGTSVKLLPGDYIDIRSANSRSGGATTLISDIVWNHISITRTGN